MSTVKKKRQNEEQKSKARKGNRKCQSCLKEKQKKAKRRDARSDGAIKEEKAEQ